LPSNSGKICATSAVGVKPGGERVDEKIERYGFNLILQSKSCVTVDGTDMASLEPSEIHICNRLENNVELANKKQLLFNMTVYYFHLGKDPFTVLPESYHIIQGPSDSTFRDFVESFSQRRSTANLWIVKPGENSNRGHGIKVVNTVEAVAEIV
jgi:hypothetical protein